MGSIVFLLLLFLLNFSILQLLQIEFDSAAAVVCLFILEKKILLRAVKSFDGGGGGGGNRCLCNVARFLFPFSFFT